MILPATPILPPATLGMLGGGQLGRFFVLAARELGYRTIVLDPDPASPAGAMAHHHIAAAYDDAAALAELAGTCSAITTEFENVPAASLAWLAARTVVRPAADAVSVCQDRIAEKTFLRDHGFATAPFAAVPGEVPGDLFPGLLKTARFGYDGKGQVAVDHPSDLEQALQTLGGADAILERKVTLDLELSVVLARGADGEVRAFPPGENEHVNGILDTSIVPARVGDDLRAAATEIATGVAAALDYVGTLGVELFLSEGRILVNELAPRPHNSGHATLDACVTDQFEQQVRALCGLPLGDPTAHSASVMVNLLGDAWSDGEPDWGALLAVPNLRMHLYGKVEPRPGRKMGHFTVLAPHRDEAVAAAAAARKALSG